jgi:PAS domain S-box-containing protein
VLNSVFDAIVTVDLGGEIIECNRGTCAMFRDKRERLIRSRVFEFVPELQEHWRQITAVSDEAEALRWELQAADRLGRSFPVELSVTAVELQSERRVVVAIRDLTKWKELQAHVVQTQKMEALGTLAGGVAHDFNNVLMVLLGSLEMALEDVGTEHPARAGLERGFGAARRGKDLVSQILTFSRKEPFELSPVDMNGMFDEACTLLRPVLPIVIELECEFESNLPIVSGDKTQLQQVFLNLVTNAYQSYGGQQGKVIARCRVTNLGEGETDRFIGFVPGKYFVLTVQDFGAGIPPSLRDRIFDPFFTTKTADEGTGMGLSVVLGIVEQHGGGIEVELEEGEGSLFTVFLPVPTEPKRVPEEALPVLVEGRGRLIVLIDDQESVLLMAKRLLERLGFKCEAFPDGEKALAFLFASSVPVSLVFTDLAMPNQDGLSFAREIRNRGLEMLIVLTTGNPSGIEDEELVNSGVTQLLSKPYGLHELSGCLGEAL